MPPSPSMREAVDVLRIAVAAGGAAADMAAAKYSEIERHLIMQTVTEKQTPEEIVEEMAGGRESLALDIYEVQVNAQNFVDQYSDQNKPGNPIDWSLVDHFGLPRAFIEALDKVARFEIKL
jgi:hypothetical protein